MLDVAGSTPVARSVLIVSHDRHLQGMTTLSPLTLLALPSNEWSRKDAERLRAQMVDPTRTEERDGVKYWLSNGSVIPDFVYKDAYAECPAAQLEAYRKQTDTFIKSYKKVQRNRKPSAEERFEMRAAFGSGKTVVNIITGQRVRT